MPRVKTMIQLIEIISRLRKGQFVREIGRETGTHRTTIRMLRKLAGEKGWLDPSCALPSEKDVQDAMNASRGSSKAHPLDPYLDEIRRYLQEGYSKVVIHRLISEKADCSEITIRRFIRSKCPERNKPVMRRIAEDSVMEVDFGFLGLAYDPLENRLRKAWVFSGRLRKSREAYREIVYDQRQETFFQCHINAFHHFGGVPKKVTPDNLKAAVVKASYEDPEINRVYRELAEHYNFMISPCLPRRPEHKGGVENEIKYVKGNFWPYIREKQRQKGRSHPHRIELEEGLERWSDEVASARIVSGTGRSPREMFALESKALLPLPPVDYDMARWTVCKVRDEWLVRVESAYYSVPFRYIGEKVMARSDSKTVKIYHNLELIATHSAAKEKWEYVRNPLHAPPGQENAMAPEKGTLLSWARDIGTSTTAAVERILSDRHSDGLRPARGVLALSKKYSRHRLEKACERAVLYDNIGYGKIKNILEKGLDREGTTETSAGPRLPFRFERPGKYFDIH